MKTSTGVYWCTVIAFAGVASGCLMDEGDEVNVDVAELTQSPTTDESPATVNLKGLGCTGTALTDHWIITAAHCVADVDPGTPITVCAAENCQTPAAQDVLYMGGARFFVHPDYSIGWSGADNDIALVLLDGAGMKDSPRVKIYADSRTPWYDPSVPNPNVQVDADQLFTAIGYGWGSAPGSGQDCSEDGNGLDKSDYKRISEDIAMVKNKFPSDRVRTIGGSGGLCRGDSGGPWFLERGGERLQVAVQSWLQYKFLWVDSAATAELVPNKWSWIESATEAAGLPLRCEIYHAGGYRYRMCEDSPVFEGVELEQGTLAGPFAVESGARASRGKYVAIPDGTQGWANTRHTIEVPRDGYYAVWARTHAQVAGQDEIWLGLGSRLFAWKVPLSADWQWNLVSVEKLSTGSYPLVVYTKAPGLGLDRLLVTSMSSVMWRPVEQWLEAEDGALTYPMTSKVSSQLGFARYIEVPEGTAYAGGAAAYTLGIQRPGDYHLWGLVRAPSESNNSFWLAMDSGKTLLWEPPVTGTSAMKWDRFSDRYQGDALYHLSGGWHDLVIQRRETGTGLDKILVTNDLGFVPMWKSTGHLFPTVPTAN